MEEEFVKQRVPEIYQDVVKADGDVDFELLKEDLEELSWLDFKSSQFFDVIINVWKVADRWGVSILQSNPRFKLLKLVKVKVAITNYVHEQSNSPEMKQICLESKSKIEEMLFFSCAKGMLNSASDEDFASTVQRVTEIFQEFKSTLSNFFIHLDKALKIEVNNSISGLLDLVFYTKALQNFKEKIASEEKLKKIYSDLQEYDEKKTVSVSAGTSTTYSIGYTAYNNDHSAWARENVYRGEVKDGKRHGFGKVVYFGGDSYEGYWENDRPEGLGLYSWKIGGRYKGNFSKGSMSGLGTRVYNSGNYYVGMFLNGKKNGQGVMNFKNGDVYDGNWEDDLMHGEGKYIWVTRDEFVGRFFKDIREGPGTLNLITGELVTGNWKDNSKSN